MIIYLTAQNFMTGNAYLAYQDAAKRKIMARYYPPSDAKDIGVLHLFDFESLRFLKSISLDELNALHFYETHCKIPPMCEKLSRTDVATDSQQF